MNKGPNWEAIYGKHKDVLAYCRRRGKVSPVVDVIDEFLDTQEITPDEEYPHHRRHYSGDEKTLLSRMGKWRFGYKTHDKPLPSLAWWAEKLGITRRHARRIVRFLVRQGLLEAARAKNGLAYVFSLDSLLDKIRAWLGIKQRSDAFTESQPAVEESQPAAEQQPIPLPVPAPEPEPEPEPLPAAAMTMAPEWQTVLERIRPRVSKTAFLSWFAGTRAYKRGDQFIIEAQSSFGKEYLHKQSDLIFSLLRPLLAPSYEVYVTIAKASA